MKSFNSTTCLVEPRGAAPAVQWSGTGSLQWDVGNVGSFCGFFFPSVGLHGVSPSVCEHPVIQSSVSGPSQTATSRCQCEGRIEEDTNFN